MKEVVIFLTLFSILINFYSVFGSNQHFVESHDQKKCYNTNR